MFKTFMKEFLQWKTPCAGKEQEEEGEEKLTTNPIPHPPVALRGEVGELEVKLSLQRSRGVVGRCS